MLFEAPWRGKAGFAESSFTDIDSVSFITVALFSKIIQSVLSLINIVVTLIRKISRSRVISKRVWSTPLAAALKWLRSERWKGSCGTCIAPLLSKNLPLKLFSQPDLKVVLRVSIWTFICCLWWLHCILQHFRTLKAVVYL